MKKTPEHYPTPEESIATMVTIDDTTLVFEGGGMRNAYTATLVNRLVVEGINFPHISGISTGSSHLCDLTSRDVARSHTTFVDLIDDPEFGGLKHFRRGHGYFNAEYIYERVCYPDGAYPFSMDAFLVNPVRTRVAAFDMSRGEMRWFSKEDMSSLNTLDLTIRASSTLPVLMPPVEIEDDIHINGALEPNGGLPFDQPLREGHRKLLIILTRPRDYVKSPIPASVGALLRTAHRQFPSVLEDVARRPDRYNAGHHLLFELEERDQAYVFALNNLWINNTESRREHLETTYRASLVQTVREMPAIKAFLGL